MTITTVPGPVQATISGGDQIFAQTKLNTLDAGLSVDSDQWAASPPLTFAWSCKSPEGGICWRNARGGKPDTKLMLGSKQSVLNLKANVLKRGYSYDFTATAKAVPAPMERVMGNIITALTPQLACYDFERMGSTTVRVTVPLEDVVPTAVAIWDRPSTKTTLANPSDKTVLHATWTNTLDMERLWGRARSPELPGEGLLVRWEQRPSDGHQLGRDGCFEPFVGDCDFNSPLSLLPHAYGENGRETLVIKPRVMMDNTVYHFDFVAQDIITAVPPGNSPPTGRSSVNLLTT